MQRNVSSVEDVLALMDTLFDDDADRWTSRGAGWWDGFYGDRDRAVPFFRDVPDESLVDWHARGLVRRGRALDLGCGPGRNAIWLAQQGFQVDAVDLSAEALDWGRERAAAADVNVNFVQQSIFTLDETFGDYDLVYDSGCFHHLPPHRRVSYRWLLERVLADSGVFGLVCFAWGEMGSEEPDLNLYRGGRLHGGVAYRDDDLRRLFGWLTPVQLRRMQQQAPDSPVFGEDFLWAGLFRADLSAPPRD